MKKIIPALALMLSICLIMSLSVYAADPFSIRTSLNPSTPFITRNISVAYGEILEMSAADIERRLDMPEDALQGITFTSLPPASGGQLILDGVEIEQYEHLTRDELDRLCFVPAESVSAVSVSFLPHGSGAATASLQINVLATPNLPPSIEGTSVDTLKNVSVNGYVYVIDPEEDSVVMKVVKAPAKGTVRFTGQTFLYEPYKNMTGKDSFTVCAVDTMDNYSQEATVSVAIENNRNSFTYADMVGNPSLYAAIKLQDRGVMTGRQIGKSWYFNPDDMVERGNFLVMLMAACGIVPEPSVNTGLPNDTSIPAWLKPYVKTAIAKEIISPSQAFVYDEIPIRAEAVFMTARAAEIDDVKDFALSMPDAGSIPEWAQLSYKKLSAYKMLDLHDGYAHPQSALTNSYAADLIWQLYKHKNR